MPLLRSRPAISRTVSSSSSVTTAPSAVMRSHGAKTVGARHQRIGIFEVQVIEIVAALVADAQHVLEAGGRDEAGLDALAFETALVTTVVAPST